VTGTTEVAAATTAPTRSRALDGLRGAAALVVLVHHAVLTLPGLADAYYSIGQTQPQFSPSWWLSYTPLHLLWAGREAVFLFFVLSGLVLVLPVLRSSGYDWFAYFPQRIVRLYGPVAAAVAFGLATYLLVPRFDDPSLGSWVDERPIEYRDDAIVQDLTLLWGNSGAISPLWSLQWEVSFSLLLPLYVLFAVTGRRLAWIKPLVLLAIVAAGEYLGVPALVYLPLFAAGALIAVHWDDIGRFVRSARWRPWMWPVTLAVGLALTCAQWCLVGLGVSDEFAHEQEWLPMIGVTLLVLCAAFWPRLAPLLESRLMQWLGVISFSLYLIHEPIVLALRFLGIQTGMPAVVTIAIACALSLVLAQFFSRYVELPFHRLSKRVGRAVASRFPR